MKITLISVSKEPTLFGSPREPIVVDGGKVSYQRFEDSCLYDEPEENGKSITRKFTVLTAVHEADQFSDGNSFAGCWFTTKRGNQLRTFVLTTKQACKPTNVKFSNLKKFVVFEVKNKKELYDGKATVIGDVHTADGVEVLLNAV